MRILVDRNHLLESNSSNPLEIKGQLQSSWPFEISTVKNTWAKVSVWSTAMGSQRKMPSFYTPKLTEYKSKTFLSCAFFDNASPHREAFGGEAPGPGGVGWKNTYITLSLPFIPHQSYLPYLLTVRQVPVKCQTNTHLILIKPRHHPVSSARRKLFLPVLFFAV